MSLERLRLWEIPAEELPRRYAHIVLQETTSTMDNIDWVLGQGGHSFRRHGFAIQAFRQTKGRGSRDAEIGVIRPWHSGEANLLFSMIVDMGILHHREIGLVAAFAMQEAIVDVGVPQEALAIVTPNDLYMEGRKIGGLLAEPRDSFCNLGIGVNVMSAPLITNHAKYQAGCLNEVMHWEGGDPRRHVRRLFGTFANHFENHYRAAQEERLSILWSLGAASGDYMAVQSSVPEDNNRIFEGAYKGFETIQGADFLNLHTREGLVPIPVKHARLRIKGRFAAPCPDL